MGNGRGGGEGGGGEGGREEGGGGAGLGRTEGGCRWGRSGKRKNLCDDRGKLFIIFIYFIFSFYRIPEVSRAVRVCRRKTMGSCWTVLSQCLYKQAIHQLP